LKEENIFNLFNISPECEDIDLKYAYNKLSKTLLSKSEKSNLSESYNLISTKEKRYLYSLTSTKGFKDISELDNEIISHPNYIGPRQWLELLE
jgi:hypothetical protein